MNHLWFLRFWIWSILSVDYKHDNFMLMDTCSIFIVISNIDGL